MQLLFKILRIFIVAVFWNLGCENSELIRVQTKKKQTKPQVSVQKTMAMLSLESWQLNNFTALLA